MKIFTTRPPNETHEESLEAIKKELENTTLTFLNAIRGITQPNGSTIYWIYTKE